MDGIARNTTGFDADLVGTLLPLLAVVTAALTGVLLLAVVGEVLRRAGVASRFVRHLDGALPGFARRIAVATLTFSVTVLTPSIARATESPVRDWLSGVTSEPTTATTTTTTTITTPAASPAAPTRPSPIPEPARPAVMTPHALDHLVVVEGDCLWSIAAGRLAADSGNPAIDAAWRAIYALNRDVIGDDPDLIFPGLQLELPPIDRSPLAAP